jgi:hypothetical protein
MPSARTGRGPVLASSICWQTWLTVQQWIGSHTPTSRTLALDEDS